jgi:hypothetical protein
LVLLNKFSILLLVLAITTPMFASLLGVLKLNFLVSIIYASGLFTFLILNIKKLIFNKIDMVIIAFSSFFIFSIFYTISDNYMTELILFLLLPFYYINGKLIIITNQIKTLIKYLILLIFIIDIYVLIQLYENDFIYNIYYSYSNAKLKIDYLIMSQYSLVSLILLIFNNHNNTNYKTKIILSIFFIFMILISGSRFSIMFLFFILFLYSFKFFRTKKYVFGIIFISIISLFFSERIIEKSSILFNYSLKRINNIGNNDNSINQRSIIIQEALVEINNNITLGKGVNSSEKILSEKYVHNMFIETLLETGIFNFFILVFIITYILYLSFRIRKEYFGLGIVFLYLVLSYSKSFTISEGKFLFFIIGIIYMLSINKTQKYISKDFL